MSEFLENEGLNANEQHGFVKRKVCVSYLLETLDLINKAYPNISLMILFILIFKNLFLLFRIAD